MSRQGRPKGTKNITELADVKPSRCTMCGSSRRTPYENTDYRDYDGAGLEYIGMYYRSCKCVDCGQARRDREPVYAGQKVG